VIVGGRVIAEVDEIIDGITGEGLGLALELTANTDRIWES